MNHIPAEMPRSVADVADLLGIAAAEALVAAFRGERVYIPKRLGPDHELTRALGAALAAKLSAQFPGDRIDVPMSLTNEAPTRRRRIVELRKAGTPIREIVRAVGCSERQVYAILADARPDDGQGDLFG